MVAERSNGCFLAGMAEARTTSDFWEVLEEHKFGVRGDLRNPFTKNCYSCARCALQVTVKYPDFGRDFESAGVHVPEDVSKCSGSETNGIAETVREKYKENSRVFQ